MKTFFQTALGVCVLSAITLLLSCEMPNNSTGTTGITATSGNVTIAQIFETAKQTSGYTWYKKSDAFIGKTAKSAHSEPFLRTRYNATAAMMLDATGKVKAGAVFAEGSIITKELINTDRSVNGYALLIKRKADPNADPDGWVWGYVSATGAERHPLTSKGNGCIACHSIAGHIDRTLMNVSVP
ncbi:MAG: hypothetical protein MUF71_08440 [Candidatus Kapabacteria bacterium]|jgi:hypothetical protein|nr:hypothetical protein [Candidatus Kapabacteria bacterium]